MKAAVVVFPGSNCDRDMEVALALVSGRRPRRLWHADPEVPADLDLIALPGGFSFGDYLRCGAIAARAPVMRGVAAHAARGGLVLGVCNGFQVLTEAGLLPGALLRNAGLDFICRDVPLAVEQADTRFTRAFVAGERIVLPVAHHDGNFQADAETLDRLEGEGLVAFRYVEDLNGSARRIAGILDPRRRILGLMPHPERAVEEAHGNLAGRRLLEGLLSLAA